jgi:hypothetical protein
MHIAFDLHHLCITPDLGGKLMVKEPKDEEDPTGLRRFAKRIAEMKWWCEESKGEQSEPTSEQPSQQPQSEATPDQQQTEAGDQARGEEPPTKT